MKKLLCYHVGHTHDLNAKHYIGSECSVRATAGCVLEYLHTFTFILYSIRTLLLGEGTLLMPFLDYQINSPLNSIMAGSSSQVALL